MGSDYQPLLWQGADAQFVRDTLRSSQCGLETSRMVSEKSSNTDLQQLAQNTIALENRISKELKSMARTIGFKLQSKNRSVSCADAGDLSGLSGKDFDRAYLASLSKSSVADNARFTAESQAPPNSANYNLKKFADRTLPALETQQQSIANLQAKMEPANK